MDRIVVQIPLGEGTDFDQLIHIEDALNREFLGATAVTVSGHDLDGERFSIYIEVKTWEPALSQAMKVLGELRVLEQATVALAAGEAQTYQVVWPDSHAGGSAA